MSMKTITLAGGEVKAEFSGANAWLRNDGVDTVHASKKAGVAAGADEVISIPVGQSAPVYGANGTVYLLGTGSVQLVGSDYSTNPFKTSAQGGSGADEVARAAIRAHRENEDIHLSAEDVAGMVSGENLLRNPHLGINQRGQAEYTATVRSDHTLDGWQAYLTQSATTGSCTITPTENGVVIDNQTNGSVVFFQRLENYKTLFGKDISVSARVNNAVISATGQPTDSTGRQVSSTAEWGGIGYYVSAGAYAQAELIITAGNTVSVEWAKLELGTHATPFTPPEPATELLKCQRYYQLRTVGDIDPIDLRPTMATIKDIRQRGDGNYEYIAEL